MRKTFFKYVIPSMLAFALSGIYSIADGFFVGNAIGPVGMPALSIWYLKSGPASTRIFSPPYSTNAEALSLLSLLSPDLHTSHPHPIIGTPCDVPVPKNVSLVIIRYVLFAFFPNCQWNLPVPS